MKKIVLLISVLILGISVNAQRTTVKKPLTQDQKDSLVIANLVSTPYGHESLKRYFRLLVSSNEYIENVAYRAFAKGGGRNMAEFEDFKVDPISATNIRYAYEFLELLKRNVGESYCIRSTGENLQTVRQIEKYVQMRTEKQRKREAEEQRKKEEKQRKEAEEQRKQEEQREKEITSKVYDLTLYKTSHNTLVKNTIETIKDYFSRTTNIDKRTGKYRHNDTLSIYYKCERGDYYCSTHITDLSGASAKSDFGTYRIKNPSMTIEGYEVTTEAQIDSVNIVYAKGITTVKIKKDGVKFLKYAPDEDLVEPIKKELKYKQLKEGKYLVTYQYSHIMGYKNVDVKVEKKEMSATTVAILPTVIAYGVIIGGIILLL